MNTDLPTIGYIGVGLMGRPMVERLLNAGYVTSVWNRSREKLDRVIEKGACAAETPAELADKCDFVFMCLMDENAVEAVLFGPAGVAEAAGSSILVDFSTLNPDKCREFASRLKKANGMSWIDAPVSGGVPGAEAGALAIMAGGDEEKVETVRPVIENLCARFTHMGAIGTGQSTKLCNQIIAGCTMAIIAEAVNFAEKSGVDATILTTALKGGFADSIPFQLFAPRMASRDLDNPLGTSNTMLKDLNTVAEIAGSCGARLPMTDQALNILRDTDKRGDGEKDISVIIEFFNR